MCDGGAVTFNTMPRSMSPVPDTDGDSEWL
jgi:hypothetical protein